MRYVVDAASAAQKLGCFLGRLNYWCMLRPVSNVRKRAGMTHIKRGRAISGTDVAHFFSLSPKVGQRRSDYRGVSMREIGNGSPGWIRTSFSL
jgi:hypothetical protein